MGYSRRVCCMEATATGRRCHRRRSWSAEAPSAETRSDTFAGYLRQASDAHPSYSRAGRWCSGQLVLRLAAASATATASASCSGQLVLRLAAASDTATASASVSAKNWSNGIHTGAHRQEPSAPALAGLASAPAFARSSQKTAAVQADLEATATVFGLGGATAATKATTAAALNQAIPAAACRVAAESGRVLISFLV